MRGFEKSKRVTWASDVNLCQVRLFLSDDAPLQVSLGAQDHLQAKTSWLSSHSVGPGSEDFLPPGFEAPQDSCQNQIQLSGIPLIRWICPKRVMLNYAWRVVAGEESKEAEVESQREMRVLEAVYPRESSIPQNPVYSMDTEEFHQSDLQIPSIPITPIEDDDFTASSSYGAPMLLQPPVASCTAALSKISDEKLSPEMARVVEPDVVAAASAALKAIVKNNEQGSTIDQDLLIQIFSNPKMIEKLISDHAANACVQNTPGNVTPSVPLSNPASVTGAASSAGPFYSQSHPNGHNTWFPPPTFSSSPQTSVGPPPHATRDMNYYKNLIQQHGEERQDFAVPTQYSGSHPEPASVNNFNNGPRLRDAKGKIMKPCAYFNSPRGCRNGEFCAYQHDSSIQPRASSMREVQNSKRMRLDREITDA
ncbi:hypothetical protein SAY86_016542 [Trapa natans]|uniref:C3H1-type domain-containing protein n=1 Tax=Trapa natans TaxID=22666 RepID=A0AAN7LJY5_TRANT|nr:hypothetical protein SAY86_016542 [Trapa natans]